MPSEFAMKEAVKKGCGGASAVREVGALRGWRDRGLRRPPL
ncbi:hypothetical protein [Chroococcidiopsis sp [FACHB-1243]]|nr:hypothetical protein [Chroococcidiopsis sp. [FACHB-1243]]